MVNPEKARLRILLFDDSSLLRSTLRHLFRNEGWEVMEFPDPDLCPLYYASACKCRFSEVCADVIVTDLEMLHINGFTFVRDLLQKGCRIPFLAMFTASEDAALLDQAKALGFKIFSKPDGITPLMEWMHNVERLVNGGRLLAPWSEVAGH